MAVSPTVLRRPASPSDFPVRRDAFLGRRVELSLTHGAFVHGVRVVTVSGGNGVGKTRFAAEYATSRKGVARFGGRRTYCPLEQADSVESIARAVALALGIPASGTSRVQQVARALAARGRMLLVLDGVEGATRHAHACVADWAKAAPDVCFLVAARSPLGVPGERVITLEPLPVPAPPRRGDHAEAVALLLDRVSRIRRAFEPTPAERKMLGALARDLEGIPLAIEVAASCVALSGVADVHARVQGILAEIKTPTPPLGLRVALDLAWEHLSPFERDVFTRAAVFRDGFTIEALGAAVPGYSEGTFPLHEVVQALRRDALFVPMEGSPPRFMLRPSVRTYADQRLLERGVWNEASERHAAWFAASAMVWAADYERHGRRDAFERLRAEQANLTAALSFVQATADETEQTLRLRFALLTGLHPLAMADLSFDPYRAWLDEALEASETVRVPPMSRARALLRRREVARMTGTLDGIATAEFDQVHAIARAEQDDVLDGLAILARAHEGDLAAYETLTVALGTFRRQGYPAVEAAAAETLGQMLRAEGRLELAIERFRRALEVRRTLGDVLGQGRVLAQLLHVSLELEAHAVDTQAWLRQALAIHRAVRDPWSESLTKSARGLVQLDTGHARAALVSFREALDVAARIGLLEATEELRGYEGIALFEGGQPVAALQTLGGVARALECLSLHVHAARCRAYAAVSRVKLNQIDAATEAFAEVDREAALIHAPAVLTALAIHRAQLDLALAAEAETQGAHTQADELRSHARERIQAVSPFGDEAWGAKSAPAHRSVDVRLALRAFERMPGGKKILAWVRRDQTGEATEGAGAAALEVGPLSTWFRLPGGRVVPCKRVPTLARLLEVLAVARDETPGGYVKREQLMEAAWPGQPAAPAAAKNRLHVAIARLRGLGLHDLVLGSVDGYRLDPSVPFRRVET